MEKYRNISITFAAPAALVFLLILNILAPGCRLGIPSGTDVDEPEILPVDPAWETPLMASDLPALQLHQGGSDQLDWKFANMLKGCELWLIATGANDTSPSEAASVAASVDVDEKGWPTSLPSGFMFQAHVGY